MTPERVLTGLTQSALFWPVAALTAVVTVAAAALPQPSTVVSLLILAAVVSVLGIPHGSVDHLVGGRSGGQRFDRRFHARYVALVIAALFVWVVAPTVALVGFILLSIHHFGQSDLAWCRLPPRSQLAVQWSRGLLLVGLPLVGHLDVVAPTVERLGGGRPDEWSWLAGHAAVWSVVLVVQHLLIGIVSIGPARRRGRTAAVPSSLDDALIRREAVGVAVLVALFVSADPLVGFAIYFGLWHSLGHVLVLRAAIADRRRVDLPRISWSEFGRLALPRTSVAVLGVVGIVVGLAAIDRIDDAVAVLFVLVSALTVPHLVVVERMWATRDGPTIGSWDQGEAPEAARERSDDHGDRRRRQDAESDQARR